MIRNIKDLKETYKDFIENYMYEKIDGNKYNRIVFISDIHGWYSVDMITDRGITHEIVRHREETSFAQESTRYCNYSKNKFDNGGNAYEKTIYCTFA